MLKLTLNQDEYVTIGGDIVVQITRIGGNQVELAVQADRSVPIVRGEVLERQGGERPACLAPPLRKKRFHPADGPVGI